MLRLLVALGLLVLLALLLQAGGRGNVVNHVYPDGSVKIILASEGSCRHHLTAHPLDTVVTVTGESHDAANCN